MKREGGDIEGAILAGGKSRRMGRPKPFVELGGSPLILWVLESLRTVCREVCIVTDRVEPFAGLGCRVLRDRVPGCGPMGGIYTALSFTGARQVFVTACDTPFLNPQVVRYLASRVEGYDVVVPRVSDGLHPLQAVYTRDCLPWLYESLTRDRLSLIDFLPLVRVREVSGKELRPLDPQRISFMNINTPQDLERAEARLLQGKSISVHPVPGGP